MDAGRGQASPPTGNETAGNDQRPEAQQVLSESRRPAPVWVRGFGELSDPARYVPREETERVLGEMLRCAARPGEPAAVIAAPGFGKTLLLRLMARRLSDQLHCIYLPYGAMSVSDLSAFVLAELRRQLAAQPWWDAVTRRAAGDSTLELRALAQKLRVRRSGILLLIDDADGLPAETARTVGEWALGSRGAIRLAIACCDDSRGSRAVAAARIAHVLRLRSAMTEFETSLFVRAQLEFAAAPVEVQRRADAETIRHIHLRSNGVPRLVQRLVAWELSDLPPGVHAPSDEHGLVEFSDADSGLLAASDRIQEWSGEWSDSAADLEPELPADLRTGVDRPPRSS